MSEGDVRDYRSLGEVLRGARESKGWSPEQLSERSKIVPRMITALEHDDYSEISSPVYARGFIRTLAGQLDLDPEWCLSKVDLRDATLAVPEAMKRPTRAVPEAAPTAPTAAAGGPVWQVENVRVRKLSVRRQRTIPWVPILVLLVVIALVLLGLWALPFLLERIPAAAPDPMPSREGVAVSADSTLHDPQLELGSTTDGLPTADGPGAGTGLEASARTSTGVDAGGSRTDTARVPPPTPASSPLEAVTPGSSGGGMPSVLSPDRDRQRPMTLLVRARSRVELTVAVDGQPARQRVLRTGEIWTLGGRDHFSLRASDPAAIEVDLDGVKRTPPPGWAGDEWLLYPLPEGRGGR